MFHRYMHKLNISQFSKTALLLAIIVNFLTCFILVGQANAKDYVNTKEQTNILWYKEAARVWNEAMPLGNGRMGAMIFGDAGKERIQLNEESLWAGQVFDVYPDNFKSHLEKVQQLVLNDQLIAASDYGLKHLTTSPTAFRSYQPLGDLYIEMQHSGEIVEYRRELDIENGVARVSYKVGEVTFIREYFISAVDDVLVVRLSASKPGMLNATVALTRQKDVKINTTKDNKIQLLGQIIDDDSADAFDDNPGRSGPGGAHMKFAAELALVSTTGTITRTVSNMTVQGADEVTLVFSAATDYNVSVLNYDRTIDPQRLAQAKVDAALTRSFESLRQAHIGEHQRMFNRVSLDLGNKGSCNCPTNQRLQKMKSGSNDNALMAQFFQFGRYLLMSSSRRPGRLPANLQGIWNAKMWAPWESDFHLNINLQMNYWPAEVTNLSESIEPLLDWFVPLTAKGHKTAQQMYDAPGWLAYTMSNPFGHTTPAGSFKEFQFLNGVLDPLSGAWMSLTLWSHFEYSQDQRFLRETAYPILKGASEFILDTLLEDKDGYLIVVPSTSPENFFLEPSSQKKTRISRGSTYHMSLVRELLTSTNSAASQLNLDSEFQAKMKQALKRLPPIKIGPDGTIMEWVENYTEFDPGHRHISHLIGLHPFAQITSKDEKLFDAAKHTLDRRLENGAGGIGWSRAWLVSFFARLGEGEKSLEHMNALMRDSVMPNMLSSIGMNHHNKKGKKAILHGGDGLGHDGAVFQIDANFGATAGIAEMLLQSHRVRPLSAQETASLHGSAPVYVINLLPALPTDWDEGYVRGLRARGGATIDMNWKNGALSTVSIEATANAVVTVRYKKKQLRLQLKKGEVFNLTGSLKLQSNQQ